MAQQAELGFKLKINGVEQAVTNIDELKESIKKLTAEARQADLGSKQFDEIQEQIRKARAQYREFVNDTRSKEVKDQFIQLGGSVNDSLDLATNSLEIFGAKTEAVSAISTKASQAMSIANNVLALSELKVEASTAKRIVMEKAAAAGTVILNAVQKAFNITLNANPIFLLVTVLAAVVIGLAKLIQWVKQSTQAFQVMGKALEYVVGFLRDVGSFLTGGLINDAATAKTLENAQKTIDALDDIGSAGNVLIRNEQRRLSYLEASGAKEEEILAQKKKVAMAEIKIKQDAINALIKMQQIEGELDEEQLKKLKELRVAVADLNQGMINDQAAYDKKKADEAKKANEEAEKKAKERADKAKEAAKKYEEDLTNIRTEAAKKTAELNNKAYLDAIKDEDLKARETLRIQQETAQKELQIQIDKLAKKKKLSQSETETLNALLNEQKALITSQGVETQNLLDTQNKEKTEKQKEFDNELLALQQELSLMRIENVRQRGTAELALELENQIKDINQKQLSEEQKAQMIEQVTLINREKTKALNEQFEQEDIDKALERTEKELESDYTTFEQKYAMLDEQLRLINEKNYTSEEERTAALQANAERRKAIELAELEFKASVTNAGLDLASQAAGFLKQIAGKNKGLAIAGVVVEQAAAIGKIIQNTAVANAKSVAAFPLTAGMPWVAINTATGALSIASSIAAGVKAINQIKQADNDSSGGGGGGGGGGAAPKLQGSTYAAGGILMGPSHAQGGIATPFGEVEGGEAIINRRSTQMYSGILSAINTAGGGKSFDGASKRVSMNGEGGGLPVIKTYVVASEMTSQQEANAKVQRLARL